MSCNYVLNATIQSHPMKDGCYKSNEKGLIVATINLISCSCPVHHGTLFNVLIDKYLVCKCGEIIISAHSYFKNKENKQSNTLSENTIEYIFLHKQIRYSIQLAINTHIDCANNSKSVFGAFSKQQQGALEVCCASFSVNPGLFSNPGSDGSPLGFEMGTQYIGGIQMGGCFTGYIWVI